MSGSGNADEVEAASHAWRLLIDGAASGPWNMGVDEALFESAVSSGAATLRFYAWDRPWLSLGYAQTLSPETARACRDAGVGVVRRTTGGRAVLHGGDLTYAVAAPEGRFPTGLRATYAVLSRALATGLRGLGVEVEAAPSPPPRLARAAFDCFVEPAGDELCVAGRKLVGSAQRRGRGGVLQHGSIRVLPDPEPARRATGLGGGGATSLAELGFFDGREVLITALAAAFAAVLKADFEQQTLSRPELRRAGERSVQPAGVPEPLG